MELIKDGLCGISNSIKPVEIGPQHLSSRFNMSNRNNQEFIHRITHWRCINAKNGLRSGVVRKFNTTEYIKSSLNLSKTLDHHQNTQLNLDRFLLRSFELDQKLDSRFLLELFLGFSMSLLELIKASIDTENPSFQVKYPVILNSDEILLNLKPENEDSDETSLIKRIGGWKISQLDTEIIELGNRFSKNLKRRLKDLKSFSGDEFLGLLISFLENNMKKIGVSVAVDQSDSMYTPLMIEKVGFLITQDVADLIVKSCVDFKLWELLETLIVNGVIGHLSKTNFLIQCLVEKKRSDLICLCIKHISDFRSDDLHCVLKYFLSTPKGAKSTLMNVRSDWETQAFSAIEKASKISKKSGLAKRASILLMVAYDGFSSSELCMHYLFASPNLDQMLLSYSISRLSGSEMLSLIRYLGKWLKKYERFPEASPCPEAGKKLGLKACEWVPSLESVVKCLGLVLDEHFSSLVICSDFHEELKSIEGAVKSLALEAKLCCSVADLVENVKPEITIQNNPAIV